MRSCHIIGMRLPFLTITLRLTKFDEEQFDGIFGTYRSCLATSR